MSCVKGEHGYACSIDLSTLAELPKEDKKEKDFDLKKYAAMQKKEVRK